MWIQNRLSAIEEAKNGSYEKDLNFMVRKVSIRI